MTTPWAKSKELVTFWGSWTPTQSMERTEDNPLPHNKILEVLDGYTAEHPDVSIEWIRIPQGISSREWTIAQQTAGDDSAHHDARALAHQR